VTGHKGMGGTVRAGTALVTGREPREWLYVAMTRGVEDNTVVDVTYEGVKDTGGATVAIQPKEADPKPGTGPDPELCGLRTCLTACSQEMLDRQLGWLFLPRT
jgi:hypothetical protein